MGENMLLLPTITTSSRFMVDFTDSPPPPPMLLVLGETGAGKSTFISTLSPGSARVGHSLSSCTVEPQTIQATISNRPVILVDTPGFNDTHRSDIAVLREIAGMLTLQYRLGAKLCGVLYLHDISGSRMTTSSRRQLEILQQIVGKENFGCVMLVTTKWPTGSWDKYAPVRERELRREFWKPMLSNGAKMARFDGTREHAACIVRGFWNPEMREEQGVVLRLQKEMVDERLILDQTAAGRQVLDFRRDEEATLEGLRDSGGYSVAGGFDLIGQMMRLEESIARRKAEEEQLKEDILEKVQVEVEKVVKKEFDKQGIKPTLVNVIGWLIGICSIGLAFGL